MGFLNETAISLVLFYFVAGILLTVILAQADTIWKFTKRNSIH
jgi:hypothetical protein